LPHLSEGEVGCKHALNVLPINQVRGGTVPVAPATQGTLPNKCSVGPLVPLQPLPGVRKLTKLRLLLHVLRVWLLSTVYSQSAAQALRPVCRP
jgi:hypothetical protein